MDNTFDSFSDIEKLLKYNDSSLSKGSILQKRYKITRKITEGGMGKVFQALDMQTGAKVCVKQMLYSFNKEEQVARFTREYNILRAISHQNIVKVFDFFEELENYYIILEYLEGLNLRDFIVQTKEIELSEKLAIASQISRAVEVINTAGILHRDIKPANIMVDMDQHSIKLLDLGLGKNLKQQSIFSTAKGDIIGTPEYMSPEQVSGGFSYKSDIFSLGVTLYQFFLNSKNSPFKSTTAINSMNNILEKKLSPLYKEIKDQKFFHIYKELSKLLAFCMEKKVDRRLANAGELANEINRLYALTKKSKNRTEHIEDYWSVSRKIDVEQLKTLQNIKKQYGKDKVFEFKGRGVDNFKRKRDREKKYKYRFIICIICITLFVLFSVKSEDEGRFNKKKAAVLFEKALSYYDKSLPSLAIKKLDKAYRLFPDERYMVQKAIMISKNEEEQAIKLVGKYLEKLLKNKDSLSFYLIGTLYVKGLGVEKNYPKAFKYLTKSAAKGNTQAMIVLAFMNHHGLFVEKSYLQEIYWLKKAAKKKSSRAMNGLSNLYLYGQGFTKDKQLAFYWKKQAALLGHRDAMIDLGYMYKKGYVARINVQKAIYWFSKGVELKSAFAMNALAGLYLFGEGIEKDYNKALKLLKESVALKSPIAMITLSYMYRKGYGVKKNIKKAIDLLHLADKTTKDKDIKKRIRVLLKFTKE